MGGVERAADEYSKLLKHIGETLARTRLKRGMSQRELAEILGKSQSIIAKVEKYPSRDISFRCIYEVCRGLPVSMGDVVLEAEKSLELYDQRRLPTKVTERMKTVTERLNCLPEEEQEWIVDMLEVILKRTRLSEKTTRRTDTSSLTL